MDLSTITPIAEFFTATGPYGLLAIIAVWFNRYQEKKDNEIREVYDKVIELAETQTQAITKVEAAVDALRHAIDRL